MIAWTLGALAAVFFVFDLLWFWRVLGDPKPRVVFHDRSVRFEQWQRSRGGEA